MHIRYCCSMKPNSDGRDEGTILFAMLDSYEDGYVCFPINYLTMYLFSIFIWSEISLRAICLLINQHSYPESVYIAIKIIVIKTLLETYRNRNMRKGALRIKLRNYSANPRLSPLRHFCSLAVIVAFSSPSNLFLVGSNMYTFKVFQSHDKETTSDTDSTLSKPDLLALFVFWRCLPSRRSIELRA